MTRVFPLAEVSSNCHGSSSVIEQGTTSIIEEVLFSCFESITNSLALDSLMARLIVPFFVELRV